MVVLLVAMMGLWPTTTGTDLKQQPKQKKACYAHAQNFTLFNPLFLINY